MHLFWQYFQKSPILRCLLKEMLSELGKWTLQRWNLWGRGWQPSKNGADCIFLSCLQRLSEREKIHHEWVDEGRSSLLRVRVPQPPVTSSVFPPGHQLRGSDSTYGLSQNTLFLSSLRSSGVCLLNSVYVIHVAHVLSLVGLSSKIMWTLRHKRCNFSYAASSHITSDICKH